MNLSRKRLPTPSQGQWFSNFDMHLDSLEGFIKSLDGVVPLTGILIQ